MAFNAKEVCRIEGAAFDSGRAQTVARANFRHYCGANIALQSGGLGVAPILILQLLSQFAVPEVANREPRRPFPR